MNGLPGISRLAPAILALLVTIVLPMASSGQQTGTGFNTTPTMPPATAPSTTPKGIMLVEVHQERGSSSDPYFWTRLGNADGWTLLYSTSQKTPSNEFEPVLAANGATAFDDWSLVATEGATQWAYQGHPLYVWSRENEPGEIALNVALYGVGENGERPLKENRSGALMPPEGWRVARFTPSDTETVPDGFDLKLIDSAQGVILTDFEGYSLYGFEANGDSIEEACAARNCLGNWTPVAAPALARDYNHFSIIERIDGSRQWAFQGKPLFRFSDDLLPGDVHGRGVHPRMQLALLKENFRPQGVDVMSLPGYGDIYTLNGRTLYFGSAFEKYWGGRNLRGSFEIAYHKGKRLGANACVSEECLENWHPFSAPADARSSGFWEVVTRPDGSRQWAYKGFALYTFNEDEAIGHIRGHSLYDIADVDGDAESIARTRLLAEVGNAPGGAGIYWSIAKP